MNLQTIIDNNQYYFNEITGEFCFRTPVFLCDKKLTNNTMPCGKKKPKKK